MHKIILENGTTFKNVILNGNNYIFEQSVDTKLFENQNIIKIIDSNFNEEIIENFNVIFSEISGSQSVIFLPKTNEQIEIEKLKNTIDALALDILMGGV